MDKENKRQNIDAGCDADYGEDEDVVSYRDKLANIQLPSFLQFSSSVEL